MIVMDTLTLMLGLLAVFFVLGLASLAWGVDSRESFVDDRRR